MGGELRWKSQHDLVQTISIDSFQVEMLINNPIDLTSDFIVKYLMGKPFDKFRNIMKNKKLEDFCRPNFFGHFLKLPEEINAHFQMSIVYGLIKYRIKYMSDDKYLKDGDKKGMKCGLTNMAWKSLP